MKEAATRFVPLNFVFAIPALPLLQPKISSMRLRMTWLILYPAWRVVRRSIAVLRVLPDFVAWPLIAMCGVTFRLCSSFTKSHVSKPLSPPSVIRRFPLHRQRRLAFRRAGRLRQASGHGQTVAVFH
jgi:hypothetical protein